MKLSQSAHPIDIETYKAEPGDTGNIDGPLSEFYGRVDDVVILSAQWLHRVATHDLGIRPSDGLWVIHRSLPLVRFCDLKT
jgi:hypothetical protein